MSEYLLLKWGGLKGWKLESEASMAVLRKIHEDPVCLSAAMQRNTDHQVDALCELIDAVDGEIMNDWTGKKMTKNEAKKYVREYRHATPTK